MNHLLMLLLLGISVSLSACQIKDGAVTPTSSSEKVQTGAMEVNAANDDKEMQIIISAAKAKIDQQLQSQEPEQQNVTQKFGYPLDNM